MNKFTRIIFIVGFLALLFGAYTYAENEIFLRHAVIATAKIQHVSDKPIAIITEGRLNGPHSYTDHTCRYTVSFKDNQTNLTTELNQVGHTCLLEGSSILVRYDPKSPSDTVENPNHEELIHPGLWWLVVGAVLMFFSYLDFRRSQRNTNAVDR